MIHDLFITIYTFAICCLHMQTVFLKKANVAQCFLQFIPSKQMIEIDEMRNTIKHSAMASVLNFLIKCCRVIVFSSIKTKIGRRETSIKGQV